MLNEALGTSIEPVFRDARPGDIRCSWADISKARQELGYEPMISVREGLEMTVDWFRTVEKES